MHIAEQRLTSGLCLLWLLGLLYASPAIAQPCPHDGDVNQNGHITPNDALLVFKAFLGLTILDPCQQDHANPLEPTASGITPADALCIFRRFLGVPSCLDIGPLPEPLATCRARFFARQIVEADVCFQHVLALQPTQQEANLFRIGTRFLRIAEEHRDGPNPAVFTDSFKEMLDRFGISLEGRSVFDFFATPPEDANGKVQLPPNAPTGEEMQRFLRNTVLPAITAAIEENLAHIDAAFALVITQEELESFGFSDTGPVELDFGDSKILEAILYGAQGACFMLFAYDTNLNFSALDLHLDVRRPRVGDVQIQRTILDAHQTFLTLKGAESPMLLTQAKSSFRTAIEAYFAASLFIRTQDDADQSDDFVTITADDLADEEEFRRLLGETRCSLDGQTLQALTDTGVVCATTGTPALDGEEVNLSRVFDPSFNLRAVLPPFAFDTTCMSNFIATAMPTATFPFPDPTFRGILPGRTQAGLIDLLDLTPEIDVSLFPTRFIAPPGGSAQGFGFLNFNNNKSQLVPPLTIKNVAFADGSTFHFHPILTAADFPILLCEENDDRSIDVVFTPPARGSFPDSLIVQSNDPLKPTVTIPVSGCGGNFQECSDF